MEVKVNPCFPDLKAKTNRQLDFGYFVLKK
jgi:hypothetical protein